MEICEMVINNVTEAVKKAREKLVEVNGIMGVIMLQIESVNLIKYLKNQDKETWKVKCSYYTNMAGVERVTKEIFIDKESGEVVDLNGYNNKH